MNKTDQPWVPDAGQLIWLEFGPSVANEQDGRRPALVISGQEWNVLIGRCLAMPVTKRVRGWPSEIILPPDAPIQGAVLADQVRTVSWTARHASLIGQVDRLVLDVARKRLAAIAGIV